MAAVTGLTIVKGFTYRDDPSEEFSNTYHFKNPPPGDAASWGVVLNAALSKEQAIFPATTHFVRAYGYDSDDPNAHHVFSWDWTQPGPPPTGSFSGGGTLQMAGDQAACVEWMTSRLNSRGKKIYLRKYFHTGYMSSSDHDKLDVTWLGALNQFAGLTTGMNLVHGGLRSRTHDETLQVGSTIQWVTTRTLKRRGKRPKRAS